MNHPPPVPPWLRIAYAARAAILRELHAETCRQHPNVPYYLQITLTAEDAPCTTDEVEQALDMAKDVLV